MNIESALIDLVGEPAKKLHTARSRNDQVQTDVRLYVRDSIDTLSTRVLDVQRALFELADKYKDCIIPGTGESLDMPLYIYISAKRGNPTKRKLYDCRFLFLFFFAEIAFRIYSLAASAASSLVTPSSRLR